MLSSVEYIASDIEVVYGSQSRSQCLVRCSSVNNNNLGQSAEEIAWRRRSSTQEDFLDLSGNFLSVASSEVIADMSGHEEHVEEVNTGYSEGFLPMPSALRGSIVLNSKITDIFLSHNLKEHVLKYKKNPTLGPKSEK